MLGFVFDPLLAFVPVIAVTIFAIVILIIINLIYKFLINQQEAKYIKERTKELNEQMKSEQKAGNNEKVKELMSQLMTENSKMMRLTMKPMLVSFIVIILFLPWLSSNFGDQTTELQNNAGNITIDDELYFVQLDGDQVSIEGSAASISFTTSAIEEDRRFEINNKYYVISYEEKGGFIFTHPEQMKFAKVVALLPEGVSLPLFGNEFGWLGWYLIVSIPLMILIRKILKINV